MAILTIGFLATHPLVLMVLVYASWGFEYMVKGSLPDPYDLAGYGGAPVRALFQLSLLWCLYGVVTSVALLFTWAYVLSDLVDPPRPNWPSRVWIYVALFVAWLVVVLLWGFDPGRAWAWWWWQWH